ncbi:response regulator [Spirosoma endbachense]|uniref:Response regulator n=1 Tax=Spirosoma endbachense TaxID=2666025 RepID=A0A6P1VTC3_9BACT|nr:response regulator [Spirosoma endbachense]QHV95342.1 response regulator [Spirosoma endbachense]
MHSLTKTNISVQSNFKNANVLIIDDNRDHGMIMQDTMSQCLPEILPVLVHSEEDALAYLNQCSREEWTLPKLILLDLYLPTRQNGWHLLEQIKALPAAMGKIPVVLLSQSTDKRDIREAYQRGCSSYLVKPLLSADWLQQFQALRAYWWETVTLPKIGYSLF